MEWQAYGEWRRGVERWLDGGGGGIARGAFDDPHDLHPVLTKWCAHAAGSGNDRRM